MRGRSLHATLTAAALLASAATLARAQDIDLFADADPVATANIPAKPALPPTPAVAAPTPAAVPMPRTSLTIEPSDWAPGHAAALPQAKPDAPAAAMSDTGKPKAAARLDDPDTVVKPAVPAPAKDPLDATKPAETGKTPEPAAAAQVQPLPPLAAAIKAALDKRDASEIRGPQAAERRKERAAVDAYYAARKFQPVWSDKGAALAAADPVLARLARAADDALSVPGVPAKLAV